MAAINILAPVTTTNFTATNFTPGAGVISLGAGSAAIGSVTITGTVPVSFTQLGLTDTQLRASAVPVSLASVPTHAVTLTSTSAVSLASLPALTTGAATIGAVNINGTVPVSLASTTITGAVAATQSGTWNDIVTGNVAAGTAASGNPVRIGAVARTTNPTAVTDGQVSNFRTNKVGDTISITAPRELVGKNTVTLTTTTETTLIAAGAAGVFNDISALSITNSSATGVTISLREATAGAVVQSWYIPPGGGGPISCMPFMPQLTAANNWTVQLSAAVTSVLINVIYVKNI
jgi:hypothetical protein